MHFSARQAENQCQADRGPSVALWQAKSIGKRLGVDVRTVLNPTPVVLPLIVKQADCFSRSAKLSQETDMKSQLSKALR